MVKTKKEKKDLKSKVILVVNILCALMIFWVAIENKTFSVIFFSLLIASQCIFWGIRKLRDDKKWVGSYSPVGIVLTASSIIPLYIAIFFVIYYGEIEVYLHSEGRSGLKDILKITFFLKP